MDKKYIEEITITNAATNFPGIDVSVVRDYMTGRTPEIKCKECKFKAAPLGDSTYCNKQKRIVYASGCNYGELKRITNADRIRAMSDEELAEFYGNDVDACPPGRDSGKCIDELYAHGEEPYPSVKQCMECWLDWLKQEVTNDP